MFLSKGQCVVRKGFWNSEEGAVWCCEPFGRLNELVKQAGGCVAIDGGFATQLERHGAEINDPLWSALCLITMPELIRKVISHVLPLLRLQVVPNQSPGRC
jgi:hypothetical protein